MSETLTYKNVVTVVVHYRTPDLLQMAVESFRGFYPDAELLIIDNGSPDPDHAVVRQLAAAHPGTTKALLLERNVFHGPAMHLAMNTVQHEFVFFLDSDTITRRGGFLEAMSGILDERAGVYGVGRVGTVNKRGFHDKAGTKILFSPYMMVRRSMYRQLPPFEHHGAPTLRNFQTAAERNWVLADYPVQNSVEHLGRGTSGKYGYGLGLKGTMDYVLNKIGL